MADDFDPATLDTLTRREIQALCKARGIKANGKTVAMIASLEEWYIDTHTSVNATLIADESDSQSHEDEYEDEGEGEGEGEGANSQGPYSIGGIVYRVRRKIRELTGSPAPEQEQEQELELEQELEQEPDAAIKSTAASLWTSPASPKSPKRKYTYASPLRNSATTKASPVQTQPQSPTLMQTQSVPPMIKRGSGEGSHWMGMFVVVAVVVLAYVMVHPGASPLVSLLTGGTHYCSHEGPEDGCIPCPLSARCFDGVAECASPVQVVRGDRCVDSPEFIQAKTRIAADLTRALRKAAGDYTCGLSETGALNEDEVKALVKDAPFFAQAWPDILGSLTIPGMDGDADGDVPGTVYYVRGDDEAYEKAPERVKAHPGTLLFWVPLADGSVSWTCGVKVVIAEFVWEHIVEAVGALVVILAVWRWRASSAASAAEAADAAALCNKILFTLYEQDQSIPRSHLRNSLLSVAEQNDPRVSRVWEKAVDLVLSNPSVREIPRKVHGEHEMVWEWMSNLKPHGYPDSSPSSPSSTVKHLQYPSPPPPFDSPHTKVTRAR